MDKKFKLDFNSPVILGLTFLSLIILIAGGVTGGKATEFFAIRYTSWSDPLMYMRLFTHILSHENLAHYSGNFMMILVIGPLIEEKYGSASLLLMIAATTILTGLISIIFFKNVMLMGASGIVFMLILLASFANASSGNLPITFVLVAVLYIGTEIFNGVVSSDSISQISHIVGGFTGAIFGYLLNKDRLGRKLF